MAKFKQSIKNFFFPPRGSSRWLLVLPYAALGILTLALIVGGAYAWDYTNSSEFCGTSCHTMPPQYAAYQISPHSRVACVECHIGREFIGNQIFRKAGDLRHVFATIFTTYEYPIQAKHMRPAPEICERCHSPEKFSDDSLRLITRFREDEANTPYYTYLILKTGGGSAREGLGRGIHWHIENPVYFYAEDPLDQNIPYVRVMNGDGTYTEYIDVESDFDLSQLDESQLAQMDCVTCHNRITHIVHTPEESMDAVLERGGISMDIPRIRETGAQVLRGDYATRDEGLTLIADSLRAYYQENYPDFFADNQGKIEDAIAAVQQIYSDSVFPEQEMDWDAHPNNLGHVDSPGCFRCHDGTHLNEQQQAIRLECNLCHSIPVVVNDQAFLALIEISRGPEPTSHLNPNWISLHNHSFDASCSACHTTDNPGGTSNTSFCSNSACHGNVYTFAGFDAPALRAILDAQVPPPAATPPPPTGDLTYEGSIAPLLSTRCASCHGSSAMAGLDLTTYATSMTGGKSGAVIVPGDSTNSLIVKIQSVKHFANLEPQELELLIQWIDAGAPEK